MKFKNRLLLEEKLDFAEGERLMRCCIANIRVIDGTPHPPQPYGFAAPFAQPQTADPSVCCADISPNRGVSSRGRQGGRRFQ